MKDGFIKVSAGTPDVRVADCEYNADQIIAMVGEMKEKGARIMVFSRTVYYRLYLWRPVLAGKSAAGGESAAFADRRGN